MRRPTGIFSFLQTSTPQPATTVAQKLTSLSCISVATSGTCSAISDKKNSALGTPLSLSLSPSAQVCSLCGDSVSAGHVTCQRVAQTTMETSKSPHRESLNTTTAAPAHSSAGRCVKRETPEAEATALSGVPGTSDDDGQDSWEKERPLRRKRRVKGQKICGVCGDLAQSHNFGTLTCETCKAFFRRNAFKQKVMIIDNLHNYCKALFANQSSNRCAVINNLNIIKR